MFLVDTRHNGYPKLAAFNVNANNMILRKFALLRTRLLLYRQTELEAMEDHLADLDDDDSEHHREALRSMDVDESHDKSQSRKRLLFEIQQKLRDYGQWFPTTVQTSCLIILRR